MRATEYARVDTIFTCSIAAAQYKSGTSSLALDYRTNQLETLQMNNDSWQLTGKRAQGHPLPWWTRTSWPAPCTWAWSTARITPMINGTWMYNSNISFEYSLDKAKALLEEDGLVRHG